MLALKSSEMRRTVFLGTTVALLLLLPASIWAQDATPPAQSSEGAIPAGRIGVVTGAVIAEPPGATEDPSANSTTPPVQELGHGGWLGANASPLHWGSLSVGSFQFLEAYDEIRNAGTGNGIFRTSVLGTTIVYDTTIRGNRLALQWQPQVAIENGQFLNDLNSESVQFNFATALSSRMSLGVQDHFGYLPLQALYTDTVLSPSTAANVHSIQNAFLSGPGSWLSNTASVSLGYQLTERTSLTVSPAYNYVHSFNTNSAVFLGSQEYGGTVALNHQLSQTKTVGLFYSGNVVKFTNAASSVLYNSVGASFVDQLSPTWFLNASVGVAPSTFGGLRLVWTASGQADLQKRFQTSTATLTLSRGLSLNQYNSQYYTDRADLDYQIQLTRRMSAGLGIGYQGVSGTPPLSGGYASSRLIYQLVPSVAVSAVYRYDRQRGDNIQVYTQTSEGWYLTLTWAPPRPR